MEPQLQAKQSLIQIEADIHLAERDKRKIVTELEQLNSTRTAAFKQYDQQIKHKKDEYDVYEAKIEDITTAIEKNEEVLQQLSDEVVQLTTKRDRLIAEARDAVKTVHDEAEQREKAVTDREHNVQIASEEVKLSEQIVNKTVQEIALQQGQLTIERKVFEKDQRDFAAEEEASKKTVAKAQELLDDINRQLKAQRMQSQQLDTEIINKTAHSIVIGNLAQVRLDEADRRLKVVAQREVSANEKDIEQHNKDIQLDDREATIGRAYRETLQRGGKIDG